MEKVYFVVAGVWWQKDAFPFEGNVHNFGLPFGDVRFALIVDSALNGLLLIYNVRLKVINVVNRSIHFPACVMLSKALYCISQSLDWVKISFRQVFDKKAHYFVDKCRSWWGKWILTRNMHLSQCEQSLEVGTEQIKLRSSLQLHFFNWIVRTTLRRALAPFCHPVCWKSGQWLVPPANIHSAAASSPLLQCTHWIAHRTLQNLCILLS